MKKSLLIGATSILTLVVSQLTYIPAQASPVCTISVTSSNSTVNGTSSGDVICLNLTANNVTVNALGGNDRVIDNGSNNTIFLGDGDDTYIGTDGDDATVDGGPGADEITGTPGDDEITGGDGDDTIIGGDGNDTMNGGLGDDELAGGVGDDNISGDAGNDVINGDNGADTINGSDGADTLVGGEGNDTMNGGLGNDELGGGVGDDNISGDAGNDVINGGDGADTINGSDGADTLVGGEGNDTMNGGLGNDDLTGGVGDDSIFGESGTDTLRGGEGDDVLAGGEDIDTLNGGAGLNTCDSAPGETLTTTCRYDDVGPSLVFAGTSTSSVDVSTSSQPVTITLNITDSSGISNGFFQCRSGSRNAVLIYFSYRTQSAWNVNSPVSSVSWTGTAKNATLTATQSVDFGLYPGTYSCSVSLTDVLLQTSITSASPVSVIRTGGDFDDLGPSLESVTFSANPVEVGTSSATSRVSLEFADQTGLRNGWFQCYVQTPGSERTTDAILAYFTWEGKQLSNGTGTLSKVSWAGTQTDSTLTFDVSVPLGFRPGNYPCSITLFDIKDQQTQETSVATFQVTRTGESFDDSAPTIVLFEVNPNPVDVGSSAVLADVTLRLTDMTGIKDGYIDCAFGTWGSPNYRKAFLVYYTWSSRSIYSESGDDILVSFSGTSTDATLKVRGQVPMGLLPGSFTCSVNAVDTLNHSITDRTYILNVIRTPAGMPSAPSDLLFTPTSGRPTEGTLTWVAPDTLGDPNLYTYEVQYSTNGIDWSRVSHGPSASTSLSLTNLRAGATYSFRVRGENGGTIGQDTRFMNLNWGVVEFTTPQARTPDTPTNLVVSNIVSNGFRLAWTAPAYSGGRDINNFTVEYSTDNGETWRSAKSVTSTSLSFNVTTEAPGTRYLIRVSAVNVIGASEFLTGEVTTLSTLSTAPRTLSASSVTSNSLTLSWLLPTSNGGADITDYKVEFSSNNGVSWNEISHEASNSLGFNVTGLANNRSYQFRVSAINEIGAGPASDTVTATTPATVPSAPRNISSSSVLANSATISWVSPSDNGGLNITDYKVETSRDGTNWTAITRAASANTNINLTGLAPATNYLARVSALNSEGVSDTTRVIFTTLATVPTEPGTLTANSITSDSLTLSWLIPTSNGGAAITNYKVEYAVGNSATWVEIPRTASNDLAFNVTSLRSNQTYRFRVSAINERGIGAASNIVSATTLVGAPHEPTSIRSSRITAAAATLVWVAPTNTGGVELNDYRVELSRDGGATWATVSKPASTSSTLALTGLASATTYLVRVTAVNAVGSSQYLTGELTTVAATPAPPRSLVASKVAEKTLTLSWRLPSSNGGRAITNYKVEVSSNCSTYTVLRRTPSNSLAQNVTNLSAGTKYCFRVSTITSLGTSTASNVLTVTTKGKAPSAPTRLTARAAATQATISWRAAAVSNGSPVRNYIVEYSSNRGATWTKVVKPVSTSLSLSVRGLKRSTNYLFRVYAVNDVGSSPASANRAVRTSAR
jgi:fibronectin type 3 domain-containing protein